MRKVPLIDMGLQPVDALNVLKDGLRDLAEAYNELVDELEGKQAPSKECQHLNSYRLNPSMKKCKDCKKTWKE